MRRDTVHNDLLVTMLHRVRDTNLDPEERVRSLVALRARMEEIETELLTELRRNGTTWAEIGRGYGISYQSAASRAHRRGVTD
jgi:hypothetical protein